MTATGNTSSGYGPQAIGPQAIGPLASGATQTVLIPIDGRGNTSTLTVSSGGVQLLSQAFPGCISQFTVG